MLNGHTAPHLANIVLHVGAGSVVILCGTLAVTSVKGGMIHRKAGWVFMSAYSVLVATAVIGVVVFEFRSFLAVATIASSYDVFAGYRAVRLRGGRPQAVDVSLSFFALLAAMTFVVAIRFMHKPWSPALTWSVLGGLNGARRL